MSTNMTDFNPETQSFQLQLSSGELVTFSLTDIDDYVYYGTRLCINFSSQIGASVLLLVMMLILTKREKRFSSVVMLNSLSLVLNTVRSILQCLFFTGGFNRAYAALTGDVSLVPTSDKAVSIAAGVFTCLLVVSIEASLVLQIQIVMAATSEFQKSVTLVMCAMMACMTVAFRLALTVVNAQAVLGDADFIDWQWLSSATNIVLTVSIFVFSSIFLLKLGFAIRQRKRLGFKQFGPMQVIFIMAAQTMIVPAIFSVLQYVGPLVEFGSQVLTVVALFLPLSSIWASSSPSGNTSSAPRAFKQRRRPHGIGKIFVSTTSSGTSSSDRTLFSGSLKSAGKALSAMWSPTSSASTATETVESSGDVEMGVVGNGQENKIRGLA